MNEMDTQSAGKACNKDRGEERERATTSLFSLLNLKKKFAKLLLVSSESGDVWKISWNLNIVATRKNHYYVILAVLKFFLEVSTLVATILRFQLIFQTSPDSLLIINIKIDFFDLNYLYFATKHAQFG